MCIRDRYQTEVDSLEEKLNKAKLNTVRERTANRMAAATINAKKQAAEEAGITLKTKDIKKDSQRALSKAREEVGSISRKERNIQITDKEWEAIQAGAISENKLKSILQNCDPDSLRQRAMPKSCLLYTSVSISITLVPSSAEYYVSRKETRND